MKGSGMIEDEMQAFQDLARHSFNGVATEMLRKPPVPLFFTFYTLVILSDYGYGPS